MITYNNENYLTTNEFLELLPKGSTNIQNILGLIKRGKIKAVKVAGTWFVAETMVSVIVAPNNFK